MSQYHRCNIELIDDGNQVLLKIRDRDGKVIENWPSEPCGLSVISNEIGNLADKIRRNEAGRSDMDRLGELLFESLFRKRVRHEFRSLLADVSDEDINGNQDNIEDETILRLEVDLNEDEFPAVAELPWEFIRAPQLPGSAACNLGTHSKIAFSRGLKSHGTIKPLTPNSPMRIQLVISEPEGLGKVAHEEIEGAIRKLAEEHPGEIAPPLKLLRPTLNDIDEALAIRPDILHFIGHGRLCKTARKDAWGELALFGPANTADWCKADEIGELFERYKPAMVFLQACESGAGGATGAFAGMASRVFQQHVPVVLSMQYKISNAAAVVFAEEFYRRLGQFDPVDVAVQRGRRLLRQQFRETRDFAVPVLFMRVEDGRLFKKPAPHKNEGRVEQEGKLPLKPPDELWRPFSENIIETRPFPIAQACGDFNLASESVQRFVALDRLVTYLIKFLTAICIGQARRDAPKEFPLPKKLEWMERAVIENWTDMLSELSDLYRRAELQEKLIAPALFEACARPLAEKNDFMEAVRRLAEQSRQPAPDAPCIIDFLKLYSRRAMGEWDGSPAQYPLDKIAPLLSILQPAVAIILEELEILLDTPLVYTEWVDQAGDEVRIRVKKFMGRSTRDDLTPAHGPPISVKIDRAGHIKPRRLYLSDAHGLPLLDLHPFFILYRWEVYELEHHGQRGVVEFRSCVRGTRFLPPKEAKTLYPTWIEEQPEQEPAKIMPPALGEDDDWRDGVELIMSEEMPNAFPFTWLNPEGREALEIALGESLRIGRFWLGVEFLLMGLSKQKNSVFVKLLEEMRISPGELRGLLRGMAGLATKENWRKMDVSKIGAEAFPIIRIADPGRLRDSFNEAAIQQPVMTPRMFRALQDAVKLSDDGQVGHNSLLAAALRQHNGLAVQLFFSWTHQAGWDPNRVLSRLSELVAIKPEDLLEDMPKQGEDAASPRGLFSPGSPKRGNGGGLEGAGRNLTRLAENDELHPAEGDTARRAMAQIGRILLQREANNPIVIGDPGVGKTAIVEGFAWRLAGKGKEIVERLKGKRIIELSINDLIAGTKYRGDMEEKLRNVLREVRKDKGRTCVFIDEIHTILGGGASGGLSAIADAIKPALSRGEFPCIGATTVAEYRRHIEKDAALSRRFTPVWIEEPTIKEATDVLRIIARSRLAPHHHVAFMDEAIEAAVTLSARHLIDERLPGKAYKVLDQACPEVTTGGTISKPPGDMKAVQTYTVDKDAVLKVISDRTNIPIKQLAKTDKDRLLEMEDRMKKRIIGQDEVLSDVSRVVKRAGAGLADPRRPLGVFLFAGPTGVGKTELALALTEVLFDREDAIFRLDMSEFMEKHQVARLTGAPPGYVGYENEGQLTGHLRRRPYSVVLMDEIEKAHEDVQHLFLQLFDSGRLTDSQGRLADGRNAIFIMTTNLGAREALGFMKEERSIRDKLKASIEEHFSPEFLNRIDRIVYFESLSTDALMLIFDREFRYFQTRLKEDRKIEVTVEPRFKARIVEQVAEQLRGARPLRRHIEDRIVGPIVDKLLKGDYKPGSRITIGGEATGQEKSDPSKIGPGPDMPNLDKIKLGFGGPGPKSPKPVRPASPGEGLPHLEDVDDDIQKPFDELFLKMARNLLETRGISLEITRLAKFYFCAPIYLEPIENRTPERAFEEMIAERLEKGELSEFEDGEWIRIDRSLDDIVFKKVKES